MALASAREASEPGRTRISIVQIVADVRLRERRNIRERHPSFELQGAGTEAVWTSSNSRTFIES
ncbi:MAG: hypothetical protein JWP44_4932 [Mucilaginibacter sp.]|nr:hypothetical protein [Mucilaginibacter sp.]